MRHRSPLKGSTLRKPLCAGCLHSDPAFWKRCAVCETIWQLSTAECTRCSLGRKLAEMMTRRSGEHDLEGRLAAVEADDQTELRSFSVGIRTDQQAVTNGLTLLRVIFNPG